MSYQGSLAPEQGGQEFANTSVASGLEKMGIPYLRVDALYKAAQRFETSYAIVDPYRYGAAAMTETTQPAIAPEVTMIPPDEEANFALQLYGKGIKLIRPAAYAENLTSTSLQTTGV